MRILIQALPALLGGMEDGRGWQQKEDSSLRSPAESGQEDTGTPGGRPGGQGAGVVTPAAHRSRSPLQKAFRGDYLNLAANESVVKVLSRHGDQMVLFADVIMKVSKQCRMSKRILIITDSAMYILGVDVFLLKRRIPLRSVSELCLSELNDNFFAIIIPAESDCLLASTRKTEIVTVLVEATKKLVPDGLTVTFSNRFEYSVDPETTRQVQFERVDGGVSTAIF